MRSFRSDNNAGLCSEALAALSATAEEGHAIGYGDDGSTEEAVAAIRAILGSDTAVFFVATGTAANVLSIASLTDPWQQVLCHRHSHYNEDESTAPERMTGCRTVPIDAPMGKITVADVTAHAATLRGDVHQPAPGVLTVSNSTEFGTVYTTEEMSDLCRAAHDAGYRVHVDGARFANAVASLDCRPAELASSAGVDALSFGGTKNGLACGEAVCFFPQGDGEVFQRATDVFTFHRKGSGHLLSKHRFVTRPFTAVLRDGAWLKYAAHANAMARRLGTGLTEHGFPPVFPVAANAVFLRLPSAVDEALQQAGHGYYPFGDPQQGMSRLMCSFDTTEEDVDSFLAVVEGVGG